MLVGCAGWVWSGGAWSGWVVVVLGGLPGLRVVSMVPCTEQMRDSQEDLRPLRRQSLYAWLILQDTDSELSSSAQCSMPDVRARIGRGMLVERKQPGTSRRVFC